MAGEVLSNVIGAPFSEYVINQLKVRANRNSTLTRDDEQIIYLANKMSWTRLSSSVRINPQNTSFSAFYRKVFNGQIPPGDYTTGEGLAKNWILQGGTSELKNNELSLRYGLGPNGAYGLGGSEELGYRPMPGIESVNIESKGALGSLREATITFKVWNLVQLNVVEAIYFRLGYTMLLEWGHINYFNNAGKFVTNTAGLDVFNFKSKELLLQAITKKSQQTNGNYEAMLGTVTNFNFSFNQDGGYDCTLKLIGLGSVIDTIRINQTFTMPPALAQTVASLQALVEVEKQKAAKLAAETAATEQIKAKEAYLVPVAKNLAGIEKIYQFDQPGNTAITADSISYPSVSYLAKDAANSSVDYYYKAVGPNAGDLNKLKTGLFLAQNPKRATWQVIYADVSVANPQPVKLATNLNFLSSEDRIGFSSKIFGNQAKITAVNNVPFGDSTISLGYPVVNKSPVTTIATNYVAQLFDRALVNENSVFSIGPDELVEDPFFVSVPYAGKTATGEERQFFFAFGYKPNPTYTNPTRKELVQAFDNWVSTGNQVAIQIITTINTNLDGTSGKEIIIGGTLINVVSATRPFEITFFTNDTGLIEKVLPPLEKKADPVPAVGSEVNSTGETAGGENSTSSNQGQEVSKFSSALHAMLTTVIVQGQSDAYKAANGQAVVELSLVDNTKIFFDYGVLKGLFDVKDEVGPVDGVPFDLKKIC